MAESVYTVIELVGSVGGLDERGSPRRPAVVVTYVEPIKGWGHPAPT